MKKRLLSLLVAASCLLSACGGKKTDDDLVVASIGGTDITMREFNFYLDSVKQQLQGTELSSDEDWLTKDINGKKAIEVAKEQALNIATTNIAYIKIYEQLGNTLGDADMEEINKTKDSIKTQYEQNGGYEAFLEEANITDEFVDMLCKSMYCSDKLLEQFEEGEAEITNEEVNAFYDEHYNEYFTGYRRAKHVLILTQDSETREPFDDDKKAEAKEKADGILERAKAGEDFDALVKEYSEDPGSLANPEGYTFTDGEMVQEFQDCVDSLEIGEIGFCETNYGYHIIQKLEVDKAYFAEGIKQAILHEKFNNYITEKMEEFGLTVEEKDELNKALGVKTDSKKSDNDSEE